MENAYEYKERSPLEPKRSARLAAGLPQYRRPPLATTELKSKSAQHVRPDAKPNQFRSELSPVDDERQHGVEYAALQRKWSPRSSKQRRPDDDAIKQQENESEPADPNEPEQL